MFLRMLYISRPPSRHYLFRRDIRYIHKNKDKKKLIASCYLPKADPPKLRALGGEADSFTDQIAKCLIKNKRGTKNDDWGTV